MTSIFESETSIKSNVNRPIPESQLRAWVEVACHCLLGDYRSRRHRLKEQKQMTSQFWEVLENT